MIICIKCGNICEKNDKYCGNCGKKIKKESKLPVKKPTTKTVIKKKTAKKPAIKKITSSSKNKNTVKAINNIMPKTKRRKKELNYQEKTKTIYDMTSKNNCRECGCINCWQFAMQAASENNSMEISDCPYIDPNDI